MNKKKIALLIALCFFCLASVNAQDLLVYSSKNLPQSDTVLVFKPSKYNQEQSYPVIYLLHGYSGNYRAMDKLLNCQYLADSYGFIIVCPDGLFKSWYINSPKITKSQVETFFFEELMPSINHKYKIDLQNTFITGLSMGGHGALYLFLQHPELFKSAGSTSGAVDLRVGYSANYGISELLGADVQKDNELWLKYSVIGNIQNDTSLKKPIIFDCGTEDKFHPGNDALYQKCLNLKLPATYTSQPGGHTAAYWKQNLYRHFDFFKNLIKANIDHQ